MTIQFHSEWYLLNKYLVSEYIYEIRKLLVQDDLIP